MKVNIIIGRFQPFTNGHMKCVDWAYEKKRLNTVICIIDTPSNKIDKKHPFSTDLLMRYYKNLSTLNDHIENIVVVKSADIIKISDELNKYGYTIGSWTCGSDRYDDYLRISTNYHDRANLSEDFELLEVPRMDEDVSATQVRDALLKNDKKKFFKLTPYSKLVGRILFKDIFDDLRKQIELVYGL